MNVWDEVAETTGAAMVARDLIARIDDKNVVLGRRINGQFSFTPAGEEIRARLASEAIVAAARSGHDGNDGKVERTARTKRTKVAPVVAAATPAPIDAASAVDNGSDDDGDEDEQDALGRELDMALADTVEPVSNVG